MNDADEAIRALAIQLAQALTDGGEEYVVSFERIDVTAVSDAGPRYVYAPHVIATSKRTIV